MDDDDDDDDVGDNNDWRMIMIGSSLITICPGPKKAAMEPKTSN